MPSASDDANALARLRTLLAGDDQQRLARAEIRLAALETRLAIRDRRERGQAGLAASIRRRPWPWGIGALAALAVIGFLAAGPIRHARKAAEIQDALRATEASDARLAPYPLEVDEDWSAGVATLRGFAPSREALQFLVAALTPAAAPLTLLPRVEIAVSSETLRGFGDRLSALDASLKLLSGRIDGAEARVAAAEKTDAGGRADLGQKLDTASRDLEAARAELAQSGETLRSVAEAGKVHGDEILTLAAGLDRLRGRLERPAAADAPTPAAQADALRLAAGAAEQALAAAGAQAHLVVDKAQEAHDKAAALDGAEANALAAALDEVQQGAAKTEAMLQAEFEAARRRSDMANALAKSLAGNDPATVTDLVKDSRFAFSDGDKFADPDAAKALIDRLAQALQRGDQAVRVVGLSDASTPRTLAEIRATAVARLLTERGAPAALIEADVRDAKGDEVAGVVVEPAPLQ